MGREIWITLYICCIDVVFKPMVIELLVLVTALVKAACASFLLTVRYFSLATVFFVCYYPRI
jgi:hypothetical protein